MCKKIYLVCIVDSVLDQMLIFIIFSFFSPLKLDKLNPENVKMVTSHSKLPPTPKLLEEAWPLLNILKK